MSDAPSPWRWRLTTCPRSISGALAIVAIGATMFHGGTGVQAQTAADFLIGDDVVVDADALQFRSDATLSAEVIDVLGDGTWGTITDGPVTADDYTWYAIDVDGASGWVASDYLELAAEAEAFPAGAIVTVTSDSVNVRETAGLDGAIVATLDSGMTATVISGPETVDDYEWYQVESDGVTGWVVRDYLVYSGGSIPLDAGTTAQVNTDTLTLRDGAGFEARVIDYLAGGATLTIVSGPTDVDGYQWYEVSTDLGDGWVAGIYLEAGDDSVITV